MKKQFENKCLLIIDEISLLSPIELALLEQHIRDCRQSKLPFGGMAVLLIGDFCQLYCFFNESFITVMMRDFVTNAKVEPHLPQHIGAELFMKFTYNVFHAIVRTSEPNRIDNINHMRNPNLFPPVNQQTINSLKQMDRQDIIQNPQIRFACNLTPGNKERGVVNYVQMKSFAIAYLQVIIG